MQYRSEMRDPLTDTRSIMEIIWQEKGKYLHCRRCILYLLSEEDTHFKRKVAHTVVSGWRECELSGAYVAHWKRTLSNLISVQPQTN